MIWMVLYLVLGLLVTAVKYAWLSDDIDRHLIVHEGYAIWFVIGWPVVLLCYLCILLSVGIATALLWLVDLVKHMVKYKNNVPK